MEEILQKLTEYVLSLSEALDNDSNANDRPVLIKHLAASAEMYALLYKHQEISVIENLVKSEVRSHGWSFIAGSSGEKIANNWLAFTKATGIEC
ncbi:MAG: hypothetical protein PVF75_04210 [Granulosicoccaceae bacterium]|jgi:hypothetical protein